MTNLKTGSGKGRPKKAKSGRKAKPVKHTHYDAENNRRVRRYKDEAERDRTLDKKRARGELRSSTPLHSFEEALERHFMQIQNSLAPKMLDRKRGHARIYLLPVFGGRPVNAVSPEEIFALRERITAESTIWPKVQAILRGTIDEAISREWIKKADNPFLSLAKRRAAKTRLVTQQLNAQEPLSLPTLSQVQAMLRSSEGWVGTAFHLILLAGLRSGEVRALRWENVSFDDSNQMVTVNVRRAVKADETIGLPKSKAGRRSIFVRGPLYTWLKKMRPIEAKDSDFVVNLDGQRVRKVELFHAIHKHQNAIGIGSLAMKPGVERPYYVGSFGPHMLRHAAVAWWIWRGVLDMVIRIWVGHAQLATTLSIYGYLFDAKSAGDAVWETGPQVQSSIDMVEREDDTAELEEAA